MATVLIVDGEETEVVGGTQNYMEGPEGLVNASLLFFFLLFVKKINRFACRAYHTTTVDTVLYRSLQ